MMRGLELVMIAPAAMISRQEKTCNLVQFHEGTYRPMR
jgi:hypothetical protein